MLGDGEMNKLKTFLLLVIDAFLVNMAYLLAINITFHDRFTEIATIYQKNVIVVTIIYIICFSLFKLYLWAILFK